MSAATFHRLLSPTPPLPSRPPFLHGTNSSKTSRTNPPPHRASLLRVLERNVFFFVFPCFPPVLHMDSVCAVHSCAPCPLLPLLDSAEASIIVPKKTEAKTDLRLQSKVRRRAHETRGKASVVCDGVGDTSFLRCSCLYRAPCLEHLPSTNPPVSRFFRKRCVVLSAA